MWVISYREIYSRPMPSTVSKVAILYFKIILFVLFCCCFLFIAVVCVIISFLFIGFF